MNEHQDEFMNEENIFDEVKYMKYRCLACGYVYDNEIEEIKFEDLPEDWVCPLCGVGKDMFEKVED